MNLVPDWFRASIATRLHWTGSALTLLTSAAGFPLAPRFSWDEPTCVRFLHWTALCPISPQSQHLDGLTGTTSLPTWVCSRILWITHILRGCLFYKLISRLRWACVRKITVLTRQVHLTVLIRINHFSHFFRTKPTCSFSTKHMSKASRTQGFLNSIKDVVCRAETAIHRVPGRRIGERPPDLESSRFGG